jgi:hypothetical protein
MEIARALTEKSGIAEMMIHMRPWKIHNSATTAERFEAFHVTWSPHPPYSPEISLFHFCFFFGNKTAMHGQGFQVQTTFEHRYRIFDANWIPPRLSQCTTSGSRGLKSE